MNRPLREAAQVICSSIQEQVTDEQIREKGLDQRDPLYGNPDAQLLIYSNWTKFDLFSACDFSPAITIPRQGPESEATPSTSGVATGAATTPPGKPVYMHGGCVEDNRL